MDYYSMTDNGVAEEVGRRIRAHRLRKNLTQQQLADAADRSVTSIKALEKGRGKLSTLIAVLRELGALDAVDSLIQEPQVSPLQLVKLRGKIRQRATGSRGNTTGKGDSEW